MLKKILISALITSNFYHYMNCSATEQKPDLRIVFTEVLTTRTQPTQTDPMHINVKNFFTNHPEFEATLKINSLFGTHYTFISTLWQKMSTDYQVQLNNLAIQNSHLPNTLDAKIAILNNRLLYLTQLQKNFNTLEQTQKVLFGQLFEQAQRLKELAMQRYLTK